MDLLQAISDWLMQWFGRQLRPSPENCEKRFLSRDDGSRETVIKDEIDAINKINFEKIREKYENGEDLMPNCDVGVWLRDCKKEIIKPILGEIQGEIPEWLNGNLFRNGPGGLSVGETKFKHLFDSTAIIHKFHIQNGRVTYQCRYLKSRTYEKNHTAQRIVVSEFGTAPVRDPCMTIFQKFSSIFEQDVSDNCMISIYPYRDQLYTHGETPTMYRIDSKTLDTVCSVQVDKYINIAHHTAHPHVLECGTIYNLGTTVEPTGPKYCIFNFPHTKLDEPKAKDIFSEAKIVAKVKTRWPAHPGYMHSFGMTDNYFIIVEQPMSIALPEMFFVNKIKNRPSSAALKFYKDHPTLIHLISRKTGKPVFKFNAEPFFYLHIINQYEIEDYVILDICVYKDPSMIDCMFIEALKEAKHNPNYAKMFRSRPVRFVLPLRQPKMQKNLVTLKETNARAYWSKGKIYAVPEILCKIGCETPRINYPLYMGKKYRYFYAISSDVDLENPGTLIKVDTYTKKYRTWSEQGVFPSEPIFIPNLQSKDENDGLILSSLLWTSDEKKVALLILDAKTFEEIGRAVFRTPEPIPKCLHGWFINLKYLE
ncbi:carotenoid isomerooxygenase-like [Cimex lectularius]|uniref:Beta,beta-carotene 15,15'-monooxygenase n=1 Tax=Cimex lectularius TaxID=79782 RepID=A0A8I6SR66_CIMLE|nr:carotenoid isomerooxygenase-like [Cimex lectularius]